MYQVYSNFAPDTLNDTFEKKKNEIPYNLGNNCHFIPRNIKSVYHGSETNHIWDPKYGILKTIIIKVLFYKLESCQC